MSAAGSVREPTEDKADWHTAHGIAHGNAHGNQRGTENGMRHVGFLWAIGLAGGTRGARFSRRLALGVILLVPLVATACGASGTGASKQSKAAIERTCTRVADVLSDGPDPDVDPVGYALAQVRPLRAITTIDAELQRDIDALADAYEAVYTTKDKKGTETTVNQAGRRLDAICPGVF